MEPRLFLSVAPHPHAPHFHLHASAHIKPNLQGQSSFATRTYVNGLAPATVRKAYGFDGVQGDGAGQTIAIVDAYDDPNIATDLATFDGQFALPGTNTNSAGSAGSVFNFFSKVNQTGGSRMPTANSGWAQEISLDVQWAHAVAPGARVLLVEANSNRTNDLLAAVSYAKAHAQVVSMSWGGSEFSGEASYDSYFTNANVAFVASSGDTGGQQEWPAESPNVVGVGGTTLTLSNGSYGSETGWSGSGGGTSAYQPTPAYQSGLNYANRSAPDVAYDADPSTGFAVYDSYRASRQGAWMVFGGTSCGAPQWAALIAIADQMRAGVGKQPLNTLSATADPNYARSLLSAVYGQYAAGNSYSTNSFNDITSGNAGSLSAGVGYDQVTGIGSPSAASLINDLVTAVA